MTISSGSFPGIAAGLQKIEGMVRCFTSILFKSHSDSMVGVMVTVIQIRKLRHRIFNLPRTKNGSTEI